MIQLADHGGTLLQFLVDRSCLFLISFIAKMMIKISPVIHSSCPKLQLQLDPLVFFLKWNCNFQDQMETLIAGFLGLSDIIFDFDDTNILLLLEKVSYFIDIIYIGTDRSDTDQVVDLV